jgi:hypothetical protein
MKNITFLFASILVAGSAYAQPPARAAASAAVQPDAQFASWLGCWRLEDDLAGTGARMCITPEQNGVRLQTVVGTNKGIDELVIPDGVSRPITDAECKGTERSEWSADRARIFRSTTVTCGKEAARTIDTVAFIAPGPAWINVQHVSGESALASVRVQRYRRAANQRLADGSTAPQPDATTAARPTAEQTRWSIEDVVEASTKLPAEALQAALTEVRHPFDLNKRTLVLLDEGGVKDSVIDLMVALTYPQKFVVERRGGGSAPTGISTGTGWFDPFMTGSMSAGLDCYTPYGYGYRSYYSMCGSGLYPFASSYYGYGMYGYGYPYYNYGWVDVGGIPPAIGGGGGGPAEPQPIGRVVNGRGYTQIRNRDAEPAPRSTSSGNGGGWGGGGSSGVSSGGYSSGSSGTGSGSGGGGSSSGGDSGARVAVPKGGGQ